MVYRKFQKCFIQDIHKVFRKFQEIITKTLEKVTTRFFLHINVIIKVLLMILIVLLMLVLIFRLQLKNHYEINAPHASNKALVEIW